MASAKRGNIMTNIETRGEYTEKNIKELIAKVKFFEEKEAAAQAAGTSLKPDMASKFQKVVALSKKAVSALEERPDEKSRTLLGKFSTLTSLQGVAATPVVSAPSPASASASSVAKPPVSGVLQKKSAKAKPSFTPLNTIAELNGESNNGNSPLENNNSGYNSNAILQNVSSRYLEKNPLPELYDPYTGRKFTPEESPMTPIERAYKELKAIRAKVAKAVASRKYALKKKKATGKTRKTRKNRK
jgi:hypothetical protein